MRWWGGSQLLRISRAEVDVRGWRLQTGEDRALCEGGAAAEGEPEAWAPEEA